MHYGGGENRGRGDRIFTPNKLYLTFQAPNHCAKFHENRIKIAAVYRSDDRHTDRQTQVILSSVPCYAIAMEQIISKCLAVGVIKSAYLGGRPHNVSALGRRLRLLIILSLTDF